MPLEEGVRRLTGAQAALFGLGDRGTLQVGRAADVVVFDPDTIGPGPIRRLRDFPGDAERLSAPEPEGIHSVFVNGVRIAGSAETGEVVTTALPGQIVRPAGSRQAPRPSSGLLGSQGDNRGSTRCR
jgi:N-acyl-D-amino-acid deacylase